LRCLWLTLADPDPATNGQFLYSGALIRAMASTGAKLDVVGLLRPTGHRRDGQIEGGVSWWLAADATHPGWAGLLSPLPYMVRRTRTPAMRRLMRDVIARLVTTPWDAIVFDSLALGWALTPLLERCALLGQRPALVYLAQNHEASLAPRVAAAHPHWFKRQLHRLDALKVGWLERRLVHQCDVVTADAPEDCALFQAQSATARVELLLPAYEGPRVMQRCITPDVPRRAVIVGSLDWLPKRINLEEFLAAADPLFAAAGAELLVVGSAEETVLAQLRARWPATRFTGLVSDVSAYLKDARIGIVAERVGGGFKLKVLDYVFNRVPVAILAGTAPGAPLCDGESAIIQSTGEGLARAVLQAMDDLPLLNRLQDTAFATCRDQFTVEDCGRQLAAWIAAAAQRRPALAASRLGPTIAAPPSAA